MIVVSDTSPLRALAHLQSLELLAKLYGEVFIPPAVERELNNPPHKLTRVDVAQFDFIRVQAPRDEHRVRQFLKVLDAGESEALALALEKQAAAVLIDEAAGRAAAIQVGLTVIGTVGILLRAKQKELIDVVRPFIDSLENELGFFISEALRAEVLRRAGE